MGFSKMYILLFFGHFFFANIFTKNWILQKKYNFCKFAKFFADSKSRAQKLSNDVLFVIFGHQTRDLEGGGQIPPPPAYPSFQVPQKG